MKLTLLIQDRRKISRKISKVWKVRSLMPCPSIGPFKLFWTCSICFGHDQMFWTCFKMWNSVVDLSKPIWTYDKLWMNRPKSWALKQILGSKNYFAKWHLFSSGQIKVPQEWLGFWRADLRYRKVASSNTSRLEAHAGFFRLLMKGIFDCYVLWLFDKKLIF